LHTASVDNTPSRSCRKSASWTRSSACPTRTIESVSDGGC